MADVTQDFTLQLINYRCFTSEHPLQITFKSGFTAFVGPNNSGKSTILRAFFELREMFSQFRDGGNLQQLFGGNHWTYNYGSVEDPQEIPANHTDGPVIVDLAITECEDGDLSRLRLKANRADMTWRAEFFRGRKHKPVALSTSGPTMPSYVDGSNTMQLVNLDRFIKVLNSIRAALYIPAFRNVINIGGGNYYDITVGTDFVKQWDQWSTGIDRRHNAVIQRVTKDIKDLFDFKDLIINATPDKQTLQIVVDGRPARIRELGAGLSQFILVMGNVAIRNPDILLIDEPELNLHPTLQATFLTTLASYVQDKIIFATHSLGLARTVAEYIYSVRKEEGSSIVEPAAQTSNYVEFLGEMSFASYRELGYDLVLCVEGINDVKPAQQFLRLLRTEAKVVVMPLGGSQFISRNREHELAEVKRLSENVAVLIDSERTEPNNSLAPERVAFRALCEHLGFALHITERRAFENYFPERAIRAALGDGFQALGEYDLLRTAPKPWAKEANWRIAHEMTREELLATDVGQWLSTLGARRRAEQ